MVTKEGYPVLGTDGPIQIKANNFVVDEKGKVYVNSTFADDPQRLVALEENEWENIELVDSLKIVDFDRSRFIKKQGGSLWRETVDSGPASVIPENVRPNVRQGFLEGSNVNPVTEMVRMIEVNRAYEANQKVVQSQDSLTGKLINEAVRV